MIVVGERLSALGVADDADAAGVLQHPAHRGHEPRRVARPGAAAARTVRPAPVLRPARPSGAPRAARLLPVRKAHDDAARRPRTTATGSPHETFGYTPVMIEHLFDEALLLALRDGRRAHEPSRREGGEVQRRGRAQAAGRRTQTTIARRSPRTRPATRPSPISSAPAGGSRCCRSSSGAGRSACSRTATTRSGSRGRGPRSKPAIAIALGGLVAEEICLGETGTGPGRRPRPRDQPRRADGRAPSAWRAR